MKPNDRSVRIHSGAVLCTGDLERAAECAGADFSHPLILGPMCHREVSSRATWDAKARHLDFVCWECGRLVVKVAGEPDVIPLKIAPSCCAEAGVYALYRPGFGYLEIICARCLIVVGSAVKVAVGTAGQSSDGAPIVRDAGRKG